MKADAQTEKEVMTTLKAFADAWVHRDLDAVLALFGPDPDVVMLGSGTDERRLGRTELREELLRDWAQSEAVSFELGWHLVSAAGVVAWVTADLTVHTTSGGTTMPLAGRLTAVLEKRAGRWRWMQSHFSLPAREEAKSESFPARRPARHAA